MSAVVSPLAATVWSSVYTMCAAGMVALFCWVESLVRRSTRDVRRGIASRPRARLYAFPVGLLTVVTLLAAFFVTSAVRMWWLYPTDNPQQISSWMGTILIVCAVAYAVVRMVVFHVLVRRYPKEG